MIKILKRRLANSNLLAFNPNLRDRWIRNQIETLKTGGEVIDVGAGSAPYRKLFKDYNYKTQDFAQLEFDQLRFGGYSKIDYVSDATDIPVEDDSFDLALCTEVLEHVPDPADVIREISRILKPGGRVILTAPLNSGIHQEPHHYYGGFTPYWYKRVLSANGFKNIEIFPNEGFFSFFGQESIRFIRYTNPLTGILPLALRILFFPFWIILFPVLFLFFPLLAKLFDRYDKEKRFTVGYHVKAELA